MIESFGQQNKLLEIAERDRPIKCSGQVTISGKYNDEMSYYFSLADIDLIAITVTSASCK